MRRRMAVMCLSVLWAAGATWSMSTPALAGFEFPVCTNGTAQQSMPEASGTRIVWADQRSGDWDIYIYDLATGVEQPICTAAGDQMWPGIDGDHVVWMDHRSGSWAVYFCDLGTHTERKLCDAPIPAPHSIWDTQGPDISGNYVVWADYRNGNLDVFLYDLSASQLTQITTDPADQGEQGPRVQDHRIVWRDRRHNPVGDIYLYDIATRQESVVAAGGLDHAQPDIWGNRVVWRQQGNGGFDIWYRDLKSKASLPLATSSDIEDHPRVDSRYVVWSVQQRDNSGNVVTREAVRAHDLRSQAKIPVNVSSQFFGTLGPGLPDSGIVVYEDFRNGTRNPQTNADIYGYLLTPFRDMLLTR